MASTKSSAVTIVSWNCCGLGNPMTVRRLWEIHSSICSDILFLTEKKNPDDFVLKALNWMGYGSSTLVSPHSQGGGGLALFWKQEFDIVILSTCINFIDTNINYKNTSFYATFVCGEPDRTKRKEIWTKIFDIATARETYWLLTGDFNEILDNSEKTGGPLRAEGSFIYFRSFMSENNLYDLRYLGNPLSWRGYRHSHLIHCRLDRTLSNTAWAEQFPSGRSHYLRFEGSDHRPLAIYFDPNAKRHAV